jgi:outer membrane usher protein
MLAIAIGRRSSALAFRLVLILAATGGVASAARAQSDQRALLDLVVNQVGKGQILVLVQARDVWAPVGALEGAALERLAGERVEIDGAPWVRLGSLAPGILFELNERELSLRITARPEHLGLKRLELQADRPAGIVYARNASGFLNYALNWDRSSGAGLFADAGFSARGALLTTTFGGAANRAFVRGQTSITLDQRAGLRRWVIGDTFANSGLLGGGTFLGGVSVSREYGIDPYFQRYPTVDMAGSVLSPSTLEVYVNDHLVGRQDLAPGRFDLSALPVSTGHGVARLVVRDAFGRQQELVSSYYLTTSVLAKGLSEYNYHVGYQRMNESLSNWGYAVPVVLGRQRFGLSNRVTAGFRAEVTPRLISGGPTMNLRFAFGEMELVAAGSREDAGAGAAGSVGYAYFSGGASLGASVRYLTPGYATVSLRPGDTRTRAEATVYGAIPAGARGSLTVRHTLVDRQDQPRSSVTSFVSSIRVGRRTNLFMTVSNDWRDRRTGLQLYTGMGFFLGGRTTANISRGYQDGTTRASVDLQQSLPVGVGYGYRMSADLERGQRLGAFTYQGPYGRYELEQNVIDGRQTMALKAAGGLVAIGGGLFATRPVQDGFVLLRVPDVPGVRGYASNQEIGRTNRRGDLLVPGLLPYYGNRLSIADEDIPLDRTVGERERTIAPPYRGGALLSFPVRRFQNSTGRVLLQRGDEGIVPLFGQMTVRVGRESFESPIGAEGEFYLENVPPGRHPAEVLYQQKTCSFTIEIPVSAASVVNLGTVRCGDLQVVER